MILRLTCYSDIFVNATFTLDEATMLMDSMEVAKKEMTPEVAAVAEKFQQELEQSLRRAVEIQRKREG